MKVHVYATVELKDVLDECDIADILSYLDPDKIMDEFLREYGPEFLLEKVKTPILLKLCAARLEKLSDEFR
jgi:hypothetical protein